MPGLEPDMPLALIVDDDESALAAMRELVADEGFETVTATSLGEARRHIDTDLDLVLLDLVLPDGNAMDLLHDLSAKPNAHIVLLTGHATLQTAIEAFRGGATDYVIKPVDIAYLQSILSRVKRTRADRAASRLRSGQVHQLPRAPSVRLVVNDDVHPDSNSFKVAVGSTLADVEQKLILSTLQQCDTREGAARVLGISVKTLYNRIRAYRSD